MSYDFQGLDQPRSTYALFDSFKDVYALKVAGNSFQYFSRVKFEELL